MQKFSNMPLSEVASAAVPAARRVAVPTAKPASLSAEALNIPRSGIRDVFDRVERVPDAISLTVGEPSATAAPHIVAAACEAAQAGRTRYTNVLGVPEYRKAVADYSARVKGLTYDPETEIQAVDGATIGLFLALKAVVGTGDEVIIPSPFFTSYDAEVMLCGGRPVTVALRPEHGMRVNAADIEAAITPRTRAVIINSPGNPTGAVTSAAELARIAEVCKQHNIWAISDEVYHPFVFGETFGETLGGEAAVAPSIAAVPGMKDRTIVVESLSKTYAMTGWRIGYALCAAPIAKAMANYLSHSTGAPGTMCQCAAIEALSGPQDEVEQMRQVFEQRRDLIVSRINAMPYVSCLKPSGAFYVMVNLEKAIGKQIDGQTIRNGDDFAKLLLEKSLVAVVPGIGFGAPNFMRLSYAISTENIETGMDRLEAFLKQLQ
mgnify:CR=1 FL=1